MLYFIFIFLILIILYFGLLFIKKSPPKEIIGEVAEVNKNFLLVKSQDKVYFVQVTKETCFHGTNWDDIKPSQKIRIEHTDVISAANHYQTFGKKIRIAN